MTLIVNGFGYDPEAFSLQCSICREQTASIHEGLIVELLILSAQLRPNRHADVFQGKIVVIARSHLVPPTHLALPLLDRD